MLRLFEHNQTSNSSTRKTKVLVMNAKTLLFPHLGIQI
jgi:hypothetical protein